MTVDNIDKRGSFEVEVADKEMETIFGHTFWTTAKNAHLFYPRQIAVRSKERYVFYPKKEIAKAVVAYSQYQQFLSGAIKKPSLRGLHGLISETTYNQIQQSSWWPELCQRFLEISGSRLGLPEIVEQSVIFNTRK